MKILKVFVICILALSAVQAMNFEAKQQIISKTLVLHSPDGSAARVNSDTKELNRVSIVDERSTVSKATEQTTPLKYALPPLPTAAPAPLNNSSLQNSMPKSAIGDGETKLLMDLAFELHYSNVVASAINGTRLEFNRLLELVFPKESNEVCIEALEAFIASSKTETEPIGSTDRNHILIFHAVKRGHFKACELLSTKKVGGRFSRTPLHYAAENGNRDLVEFLLNKGDQIEAKDNEGQTALHRAVENGHSAVVIFLLNKGAQIEAKDRREETALHFAANKGYLSIVEQLLKRRAHIEAESKLGYRPLHLAAARGHTSIVKLLLDRGAQSEVSSEEGWTPLHCAVAGNHSAIIELLLKNGAHVNAKRKYGKTALDEAENTTIARILLRNGAQILSHHYRLFLESIPGLLMDKIKVYLKNRSQLKAHPFKEFSADKAVQILELPADEVLQIAFALHDIPVIKLLLPLFKNEIQKQMLNTQPSASLCSDEHSKSAYWIVQVISNFRYKKSLIARAILEKDVEFVEYLLSTGLIDCALKDSSDKSVFWQAALSGDPNMYNMVKKAMLIQSESKGLMPMQVLNEQCTGELLQKVSEKNYFMAAAMLFSLKGNDFLERKLTECLV